MAEYIKREDVIALAWDTTYEDEWHMHKSDKVVSVSDITELPSADVVERKHGEWETAYLDQQYAGCRPSAIYCSNCHIVSAFKTPFCPNCGADMRGGE